jgi:hypothetical protein
MVVLQQGRPAALECGRSMRPAREGASSAILQASTTGTPPVVPPPTNLSVGQVISDSVTLSWTVPQGAAGFDVFHGTSIGRPYAKTNAGLVTQPHSRIRISR